MFTTKKLNHDVQMQFDHNYSIYFPILFCRLKIFCRSFVVVVVVVFSLKSMVEGRTISNTFSTSLPIFIFYFCASGSQLRTILPPPNTFGNIWRYFGVSQIGSGGGMLLVLVGRGQGDCQTSYSA